MIRSLRVASFAVATLVVSAATAENAPPVDSGARAVLDDALRPQAGGLTASAVARDAVAASPELAAKGAQVAAMAARVDQAMAALLPRVTVGASYTRLSPVDSSLGGAIVGAANPGLLGVAPCPTGVGQCVVDSGGQPVGAAAFQIETPLDNYALTAGISVPISDYVLSLADGIAAAKASHDAAALLEKAERRKVAANARLAFYDWIRSLAQVAVSKHAIARHEALVDDARVRFQLGTATRADVLRVESLLASARVTLLHATALSEVAAERLAVSMGTETRPSVIGEDVLAEVSRPDRPESLPVLVASAHRERLEVRAIGRSRDAVRSGARALRSRKLPRLEGFFDATYANPARGSFAPSSGWGASWTAGGRLTWSVNDLLTGNAESSVAEADLRRLDADRRALENAVRVEVTAAFHDQKRAADAREAALSAERAALEGVRIARELYDAGRSTTVEVLAAEQDLTAALLQRANAAIDLRVATTRLDFATGRAGAN